jgi:sugar phosphate permease
MSASLTPAATRSRRRWVILGVGIAAQAASSVFQFGLPYLLPQLREAVGGSLAQAGLVTACPNIGLMLTLVLWGWAVDRWGERLAISVGLLCAGACIAAILAVHGVVALAVLLLAAGAAGASVNAASGRVIMAWFDSAERGLAMGARQTAQPLGVAAAALTLPAVAAAASYRTALLVPAALCIVVGLLALVLVVDPPRSEAPDVHVRSPYHEPAIWRVHAASALLIVPQFTLSAFAFLYLVQGLGITSGLAGTILAATQLLGALARLGAGRWSDVTGSRLAPMRTLAVLNAIVVALLTLVALTGSRAAIPVIVAAVIVTVSGNGLAFTEVAELAGRSWAGRALGVQNTAQNAVAALTPAAVGAVIAASSFAGGFAVAIAFPLAAALVIPSKAQATNA